MIYLRVIPCFKFSDVFNLFMLARLKQGWTGNLYGSANDPRTGNDPRTANDPGPQMIPKLDRK